MKAKVQREIKKFDDDEAGDAFSIIFQFLYMHIVIYLLFCGLQ